jgi:hypothetical protein
MGDFVPSVLPKRCGSDKISEESSEFNEM